MKNSQKGIILPIFVLLISIFVVSSISVAIKNIQSPKIPELKEDTSSPVYKNINGEFDKTIAMSPYTRVSFKDGLIITLKKIEDSRCKLDVYCFWSGELSAVLEFTTNDSLQEIKLGTVINKTITLNGYKMTLESATESNITIVILKNL